MTTLLFIPYTSFIVVQGIVTLLFIPYISFIVVHGKVKGLVIATPEGESDSSNVCNFVRPFVDPSVYISFHTSTARKYSIYGLYYIIQSKIQDLDITPIHPLFIYIYYYHKSHILVSIFMKFS